MTTIEEDVQFLLALKMVMKHDVKDKIKMEHIDDVGKKQVKRMIEAVDAGIKAIDNIAKYEKALKMMATENIPDNSYQFCKACIDEDTSRSPYAGRVCQRYEGEKGVIYTNECGRAAIVHYKKKAGLEVSE